MSDDTDKESKTEDATEKKIRDALDKGNMPFSRETPILAGIASFLVIAVFVAAPATTKLAVFLRELMDRPEDWTLNSAEDASHLFGILALSVGAALIPVFIIIPLAGIAASAFQNAPRFVGERIRPQASRISLLKGWSRIFGRAGQVEFLKSLAKFIAASVIVFFVFFKGNNLFTEAVATDPSALPEFLRENLVRLLVANVLAITAIAGFDLAWSRIHWKQELRMTGRK